MNERLNQLIELLESAANFMRGMRLDPSIPGHAKEALSEKAAEIDAAVDNFDKQD